MGDQRGNTRALMEAAGMLDGLPHRLEWSEFAAAAPLAEATAAGALWSEGAGRVAVLAKTTRNATIGFVVLGYALYWAGRGQAPGVAGKAAFLWAKFPKFVLGFLAVSLLATIGAFTPAQASDIAALSSWAFLLTFAGVGLMTDLRGLLRQGVSPFPVGAAGEVGVAVVTLALVLAL